MVAPTEDTASSSADAAHSTPARVRNCPLTTDKPHAHPRHNAATPMPNKFTTAAAHCCACGMLATPLALRGTCNNASAPWALAALPSAQSTLLLRNYVVSFQDAIHSAPCPPLKDRPIPTLPLTHFRYPSPPAFNAHPHAPPPEWLVRDAPCDEELPSTCATICPWL